MPDLAPAPLLDHPLVVTADQALREHLLRLCAVAGVAGHVASDPRDARPAWGAASLVLIGADLASEAAQARLPRRGGVVLVGVDLDDARVWDLAVSLGADSVVFLPDAESWLVDRLADSLKTGPSGAVVAVVGGRGGAGATTLAVALAVSAALAHLRCLLVDGDAMGGGIDVALGGEDTAGLRWPELADSGGRVSGRALWAALPEVDGLAVLSCGRTAAAAVPVDAMRSVLRAGRDSGDLVVVDVPRNLDDAAKTAVGDADLTLLVVPAEVRAAAAGARVAAALAPLATELRLVVRGPAPGGLTGKAVADALGLPLFGWLEAEPALAAAMERGEPPGRSGRGPLARLCQQLIADLVLVRPGAA